MPFRKLRKDILKIVKRAREALIAVAVEKGNEEQEAVVVAGGKVIFFRV